MNKNYNTDIDEKKLDKKEVLSSYSFDYDIEEEVKEFLMEMAFDADFAIVKAWKGDTQGNLVFRETARNFNPMMAMAGKITIAEVEELVPAGQLDPDQIHTPGIYVHRIFQGEKYEKRIEQRTVRKK